ncbi:hypothetical protein ACH79_23060 [Bradyrhizobium sp. CCBAU 051011]|nr:hypothetical protein ACH79_23060 [Bradyrhizobium sp. CCBAU 051011]
MRFGIAGGILWDGRCRVAQQRADDKQGKCGQICGDIDDDFSTLNNQLIFNVYFCNSRPAIGYCRRRGAKLDAAATVPMRTIDSIRLPVPIFLPQPVETAPPSFEPKILREH